MPLHTSVGLVQVPGVQRSSVPSESNPSKVIGVARMQAMLFLSGILQPCHISLLPILLLPAPLLPLKHPYSDGRVAEPRGWDVREGFCSSPLPMGESFVFFLLSIIMSMNVVVACYPWVWMTSPSRGKISCLGSSAWPRNQEESYGEFCSRVTQVK